MNALIDRVAQCWGCGIFDRLFQIVSVTAAMLYEHMVQWAWVVLVAFWIFYVLYTVFQNTKNGTDWLYQESIRPVLINSVFISVFLGMGVSLPKFLTTITFEPVAELSTIYVDAILHTNSDVVEKKVTYQVQPMEDNGFFRPQLRDKVILLMKTTITQFQAMMKLGMVIVDKAISWSALKSIDLFFKHLTMLILGAYLFYQFFKMFLKFCFYFVDVIVALTKFAFFFPFTLVFFVFKNSKAADWVTKLGDGFTSKSIKDVFESIVALAVAVITYTIIMVILAKFFSNDQIASNEIMGHILNGTLTEDMLNNDELMNMSLMACVIIGFLINFMSKKIPEVSAGIFKVFKINPQAKMGDQVGEAITQIAEKTIADTVSKVKIIAGAKPAEEQNKKTEEPNKKTEEPKKK